MSTNPIHRLITADVTARLVITMVKTMVETIDDTARIRRLAEFATDVAHLADQRLDPDLRRLIDDLTETYAT